MAQVPYGQVTTYGDIAAMAGQPAASRIVGGIAHFGDPELPYRLVNRFGVLQLVFLAGGGTGTTAGHTSKVDCTDHIVDNFKGADGAPFTSDSCCGTYSEW